MRSKKGGKGKGLAKDLQKEMKEEVEVPADFADIGAHQCSRCKVATLS